jgi:hypothetical protein
MAESAVPQKPGVAGIVVTASDSGHGTRSQRAAPLGRGSLRLLIVLAGLLIVGLGGCRGGEPNGSTSTAPSVSAPVQDSRGTAEESALNAYRGMWQAYAKAGLTANSAEPDLARYASGSALKTLADGLASYQSKGQVLKGEYISTPQVVGASPSPNPSAVSLTDCLDDSRFLVYKASGEQANERPGGRRLTRATVSDLGADGWKVTSFGVQEAGTC